MFWLEGSPWMGGDFSIIAMFGAFVIFGFVMCGFVWREHGKRIRPLRAGLSAHLPDPVRGTAVRGTITVAGDDEEIAANLSIQAEHLSGVGAIQFPPHWVPLLPRSLCNIRVARVNATGEVAVTRSFVKRMSNIGGGSGDVPTRYATYQDAEFVLLGAGRLSVDAEKTAGLGGPYLHSGAGWQLTSHIGGFAVVFAFFGWVLADYNEDVSAALGGFLAICVALQLLWIIPVVRRKWHARRVAAFYAARK